jgi:hypothetical protein
MPESGTRRSLFLSELNDRPVAAREAYMNGKILLHKNGSWLVTASIGRTTGLSVCSGDTHREWYTNVDAGDLSILLQELRKRRNRLRPPSQTSSDGAAAASPEDEIAALLVELFASDDENPFEDFKAFLDQADIPWKHDVW